jgi:hypothetical protein
MIHPEQHGARHADDDGHDHRKAQHGRGGIRIEEVSSLVNGSVPTKCEYTETPHITLTTLRRFRICINCMQTVVETPAYLRSAAEAGISDDERWEIVTMLATNPELGDLIQGSGGCR